MPYSLELTIDPDDRTAEIIRAVKAFDTNLVMGTVLNLLRERKALLIELDGRSRVDVLRSLINLLEELGRLDTGYMLIANNVWNSPDKVDTDYLVRLVLV